MSTTPSPKITGLASFLQYIRHVFTGDMLEKQLYFSLTRRRRFKRLDLYGKRQRTVHEMCKQVIDQAPRETEVVIAFGNASWKQGKGYASSPRRLRFAKYFEQFHHHQRGPPDRSVSKIHVCSHCREAKRLEKVEHLVIEKPHFVRSCASCHTLWDRDINAARNMISTGVQCHGLPAGPTSQSAGFRHLKPRRESVPFLSG
ncbi:uncharacterized protein BJ171DRAFT_248848 [Polychytrium aggregatum]|uniref:uncharacterized protein n=1 Tax=Polychytrium aggregatum TaxID=110093 RepID=UPI0022FEA26B|nr:uncharacterized protein BJ171DRAFT_248848 [Polychytrium aggregatum]KAI9193726.1 hypothetical protein BJ171DRAFT_248848 [Polychytrium aggregatum]